MQGVRGGPAVVQDIETDVSIGVNVGVDRDRMRSHKLHLRGSERVIFIEYKSQTDGVWIERVVWDPHVHVLDVEVVRGEKLQRGVGLEKF
ncbi:UNVERIFIED_CONTAM: hypothetical protein ACS92_07410 [Bacillus cereus]